MYMCPGDGKLSGIQGQLRPASHRSANQIYCLLFKRVTKTHTESGAHMEHMRCFNYY